MNRKTYHIFTLGCQMNESDSERLETLLKSSGYRPASELKADLIVVNACSVRQKPIDRIWGKLRLWQKKNSQARIVLTGCLTESDRKKFEKEFDLVFAIDDINSFTDLLSLEVSYDDYFKIKPNYRYQDKAFVPIMTGCNNYCSYCVVPYTRGRERSRAKEEIIKEIKHLVKNGFEKIVLLGQNVNSYKSQKDGSNEIGKDFVQLLEEINSLSGDFVIEFMTSHPKDMSDQLIEAIGSLNKVSSWVHLPVQSGDNQVLKQMNRGYTREDYLDLVRKLKKSVDGLILTTDIIVGFPGETEEQFQNTVSLAKEVNFNGGYVSKYSPRPGTKAEKMEDNVSLSEKKRRWKILDKLIN
jgi:tRNA-2-methylthio-N6-dimethylallyladenosine synthase